MILTALNFASGFYFEIVIAYAKIKRTASVPRSNRRHKPECAKTRAKNVSNLIIIQYTSNNINSIIYYFLQTYFSPWPLYLMRDITMQNLVFDLHT